MGFCVCSCLRRNICWGSLNRKMWFCYIFFSLSSSIHRRLFISSFIAIETKLHMKIKKKLAVFRRKRKRKKREIMDGQKENCKSFLSQGMIILTQVQNECHQNNLKNTTPGTYSRLLRNITQTFLKQYKEMFTKEKSINP